jgi:glycolate oxidase FAD binding subunit
MTVAAQTVVSRLAAIVGAQNVVADPPQPLPYEIDSQCPSAVARPATAQEIAEVLKFAVSEKLAVIPTGARTKLSIGLPPRRYDLALDLSRLNRILSYDPGDLTLSVEPALPLCRLQSALSEHRQFLPLAVPFMDRATVGGTIAAGVDSPFRQLYGTARDFVLGMEFVTGDGTPAKSGGRVVKNVTGYDLHKLLIGSLGSLAVITKVNFRTFPQPLSSRGFIANFPSAAAAFQMRDQISQSTLRPITLEIFSPGAASLFSGASAAQIANSPMPANPLSAAHWSLTTGFSGGDALRARIECDLRRIAESLGASSISILSADLGPAWARKREFIPIALGASPAAAILKIGVVPTRMNVLLHQAELAASASALPWAAMARGVGVIYFAILPAAQNEETRGHVAAACQRIAEECHRQGGNFTIPWCPSAWKPAFADWIWGPPRPDFTQMQKMKTVFDPHGILSPGRFAGGL